VDPEGQATGGGVDQCLVPDLRDIPLAQLAKQAAYSQGAVTSVLSRIVHLPESPSSVKAMMFNSAI
jgi:hypothetical protein